jgi:protein ImuA
MRAVGHDRVLDDLRDRIAHLERGGRSRRHGGLTLGVPAIDAYLPDGGLGRGALHELIGGGSDLAHGAAAALFAAAVLARAKGPVLWVLRVRDLFAPALAAVGLHPDRLIYAETGDEKHILPVIEDGLRHKGLAGVIAESPLLGLTASRRLQLAAEGSGVTAIVIHRWRGRGEPELGGTAAATRWRLTALPASPLPGGVQGVGDSRWRLELLRCRGAEPALWTVEACDETGRLRLAADVADRSAQTPARRVAG